MEWIIDSDRPVYKQLIEQIELRIVSGLFAPGDKLPSVGAGADRPCVCAADKRQIHNGG